MPLPARVLALSIVLSSFTCIPALAQDAPSNVASAEAESAASTPALNSDHHHCAAVQFSNCHWVRRPTGDEFAGVYPQYAQRHHVSGQATIRCSVKPDGSLTACEVVDETPRGAHFGEAALELWGRMRIAMDDGTPIPSGTTTVDIPTRFNMH